MTLLKAIEFAHATRDKVVSVDKPSNPKMLKLIQEVSKQFRQIQKKSLLHDYRVVIQNGVLTTRTRQRLIQKQ